MDIETREFLENMMNRMNSRFESMEGELKAFRKETNNRFEGLENRLDSLEAGQKETNNRLDKLEVGLTETNNRLDKLEVGLMETNNRLDTLEVGQKETNNRLDNLEKGQSEIKRILVELEPLNANRHIEIISSIKKLKNDLSTVEIVTASNYADIAKLKRIE